MDGRAVRRLYDAVAEAYGARFDGELAHKPFDRALLDRFASLTRGLGRVCDLGCGPGHVAAYLRGRGVDAFGADLSPGQLRQARRLHPGIEFRREDMRRLTFPDDSLGGVVAFYAVVHLTLEGVGGAAGEIRRVLVPGGRLLLAFHVGEGVVHVDELLGRAVDADFVLFRPEDVVARLEGAGLRVEEVARRGPYPEVEAPTERAYVLARKPPEG